MQKFKMATTNGGEIYFEKKSPLDSPETMRVKNCIEIVQSHTVSEINGVLCFTQKFEMAATNGWKTISLGKSPQFTLQVLCEQKLHRNRTILHHFRDKFVLRVDFQDGY